MSGGNTNQSAQRVTTSSGKVGVYDAVGIDSEQAKWFVRHVGLSLEELEFTRGQDLKLRMVDMEPPLVAPESSNPKQVDVVGTATLSSDDTSIINTFICEQLDEYESLKTAPHEQYVVHPHFVKGNQAVSARRYSCAGFVHECYLDIDITLVDVGSLPLIGAETLAVVYPHLLRVLANPRLRAMAGLGSDGPWPVLLPGYLFHSLSRGADQIRQVAYQPQSGDECFPRLETAQATNHES